ncbi:MAG: hypothetical protein F6K09_25035 [Merismopedia sp. SIO2A8]|nr:hypothetical protein [Merismopedia sp. SIO2A8]
MTIREKQYPLAVLKLVEGRDTPQSQRTWVISPNENPSTSASSYHVVPPMHRVHSGENTSNAMDIHIYLDFIGVVDEQPNGQQRDSKHWGQKRSEKRSKKRSEKQDQRNTPPVWRKHHTHSLTILRASRWLNREGSYVYEHIFSGQYDFQGQMTTAADVQARIVCDRLAILRGMHDISDLMWVDEVQEIYRQIMGIEGLPHTQAFKIWRVERSPISSKPRFPRKRL